MLLSFVFHLAKIEMAVTILYLYRSLHCICTHMHHFTSARTSSAENIIAIQMVEYSDNFLSFADLNKKFEGSVFELLTDTRLYDLYKMKPGSNEGYEESVRAIEFGQLHPVSFRVNDRDAQRCKCS